METEPKQRGGIQEQEKAHEEGHLWPVYVDRFPENDEMNLLWALPYSYQHGHHRHGDRRPSVRRNVLATFTTPIGGHGSCKQLREYHMIRFICYVCAETDKVKTCI